MATRGQMRTGLVETAQSYMGVKQGSKKHKALIDLFNQLRRLLRGQVDVDAQGLQAVRRPAL